MGTAGSAGGGGRAGGATGGGGSCGVEGSAGGETGAEGVEGAGGSGPAGAGAEGVGADGLGANGLDGCVPGGAAPGAVGNDPTVAAGGPVTGCTTRVPAAPDVRAPVRALRVWAAIPLHEATAATLPYAAGAPAARCALAATATRGFAEYAWTAS